MAPCTHPGTSGEVNEQGALILAAGRVRPKKKNGKKKQREKIRPTENTPRNPHQPSDRDHPRQRATKLVPRVSPYSPGSIDLGFVEIGLVQLSKSVKNTNVTQTHRHRHRLIIK